MADRVPRALFGALERATPILVERLASHGILRAEYVVGFVRPYSTHVWLVTESDAERDAVVGPSPFLIEVRQVLDEVGFPWSAGRLEGTVVQSQESVDRDYEGSWFYALR